MTRIKNFLEILKNILDSEKADYEIIKDETTLASAKDGAIRYKISLTEAAPTFILKAKSEYLAAIISGATRISFKKLKLALGVKEITLAKPEEVLTITKANIGCVSLLNPAMNTIIDNKLLQNDYLYGGCGIPNHTLRIKTTDLLRITNAQVLDFTDSK